MRIINKFKKTMILILLVIAMVLNTSVYTYAETMDFISWFLEENPNFTGTIPFDEGTYYFYEGELISQEEYDKLMEIDLLKKLGTEYVSINEAKQMVDDYLALKRDSLRISCDNEFVIADIFDEIYDMDYYTLNQYIARGNGRSYATWSYVNFIDIQIDTELMGTLEQINISKEETKKLAATFEGLSRYEQIKRTFEWLCNNLEYDHYSADNDLKTGHSLYSAMITKKTVCEGYALAFQAVMEELGIPCYITTGMINGVGHAWNIVQIDGKWYQLDATFADQETWIVYEYMLMGLDMRNNLTDLPIPEKSYVYTGLEVLYGDTNNDGVIDIADAVMLKKELAGMSTGIDEVASDVDANGIIDIADAVKLMKHLAGMSVELGVA